MNPTTESVTADGILRNHSAVRPLHAMNNLATGDIAVGANDPAKDAVEKKVVERVESFLGPNYNLRKHMMERQQFPERSIMSLEDAFGHYTNSDHNYLTAMIFDNLRGSENWPITQALLPLRFLGNGSSIRSYTFVRQIFNTALMEELPTYVPPQIVTRRGESHTVNLQRIGLGFNLEHDFMTTEEGKQTYEMHLQQLSNALENSIHLRAVRCLIDSAGTRQRINNPVAKLVPNTTIPNTQRRFMNVRDLVSHVVNYEVPMFGAVHKRHGLDLVNKTIVPELRREGVTPDSLLLPEHAMSIAMFSPEVQSYRFTGITASGTPYTDALDRKVASIDGMKVYTYKPFRIDAIGDEVVDPMYRTTYTGEWYSIFYPEKDKASLKDVYAKLDLFTDYADGDDLNQSALAAEIAAIRAAGGGAGAIAAAIAAARANLTIAVRTRDELNTDHLCIKVYDEDFDTCRTIDYWEAVDSARKLLGDQYMLREILIEEQMAGGRTRAVAEQRVTNAGAAAGGATPYTGGNYNEQLNRRIAAYKKVKLPIPCQMLIFRPNIVHRMGCAIMMKSGVETGETLVGYRSLTLSDDGDAGVHKGNFHCWTGSYVREPKNVLHVPDIIYGGYLGGNSNSLYGKNKGFNDAPQDDLEGDNLVVIQPLSKTLDDYHLALPLNGRYDPYINNIVNGPDGDAWDGASEVLPGLNLPGVAAANQILSKHPAFNVNNSVSDCLETRLSNGLLVRGGQKNYNRLTNSWETRMNRGHCGESKEGVRLVREGRMHYGSSDKTNVAIRGED